MAALIELAMIVNIDTTATPTIRAAAVLAVRRGLRTAFACAIRPDTPRVAAIGAPISRATGRAATGPNTMNPRNAAIAPTATRGNSPPSLTSIEPSAATPITISSPPTTSRPVIRPPCSTATSRSAASGATREARSAGNTDATSVTITPTTNPVIRALGEITKAADSRTAPSCLNTVTRAAATAIPSATPTSAASTPISRLSPAIAPKT